MSSGQKKFSKSEKGKSIRTEPDSPSPGPKLMGAAIRSASAARNLDRACDVEKAIGSDDGEDGATGARHAMEGDSIDRPIRSVRMTRRSIPFRYNSDRSIEQLADIPPELFDWTNGNVPCEETKGKCLPLPLMGVVPKVYPSYRDILNTQLGGECFSSVAASEGKEDGANAPIETAGTQTDDAVAGGSIDREDMDRPPEKKKRRRKKKKTPVCAEEQEELGTEMDRAGDEPLVDQTESECQEKKEIPTGSIEGVPTEPIEESPTGVSGAKRARSAERGPLDLVEKRQKVSDDRSVVSAENEGEPVASLPINRRLPWGGSDPPATKFSATASERVEFLYDGEIPFVNNSAACGDLARRIRGGTRTMPEVSDLAFSDMYADSARADAMVSFLPFLYLWIRFCDIDFALIDDMLNFLSLSFLLQAVARKNILIMEYEAALRRAVSELRTAEATIKAKDEEFEKAKREVLKKAKELVAERDRHCRERRQAIQMAGDLEEELETARTKIAEMKRERIEEAERTNKEMDRLRQSRLYEVMCERNRVVVGANRRFEKFRKYMTDRDKQEAKLFLHGQASGTLDLIGMLDDRGLPVPKVVKDILVGNEAKYRKELAEVVVEEITEHDLVLSPSRSVILQGFNQFGSNLEIFDSADAAALRSPIPGDEAPVAASVSTNADRSTAAASRGQEGQGNVSAGLEASEARDTGAVGPLAASVEEQVQETD
ncbi:hypothetical protein Bca4012_083894 [Brassica carinata]